MKQSYPGHNLAEYTIPACLLGVACIAAMFLVGNSFQKSLLTIKEDFGKHSNLNKGTTANLMAQDMANSEILQDLASQKSLPDALTSNTQTLVETVGSSGTTEQLADHLTTLINNLLAAGKITEEQANQLRQVSNEAHALAVAEGLLETAIREGKRSVTYEGKRYGIEEFTDMMGYDFNKRLTPSDFASVSTYKAGALLSNFAHALEDARRSGALDDPAVNKEVSGIAMLVGGISDALSWGAHKTLVHSNNHSIENLSRNVAREYNALLEDMGQSHLGRESTAEALTASEATHAHADDICTANGNGVAQGNHCVK